MGIFGQQHQLRHPIAVGGVAFTGFGEDPVVGRLDRPGSGREPGPIFLGEEIEPTEDPMEVGTEELRPGGANELELSLQRVRRSSYWSQESVEETSARRAGSLGGGEETLDSAHRCPVRRRLPKIVVIEELAEGLERRIAVGEPHQHQLLERRFAMILAIGLAGEILLYRDLTFEDGSRRKLIDEGQQKLIERALANLFPEKGNGLRPQLRSALAAVTCHHKVERLVDQTESIEIARTDRPLRGATFVQAVGKSPRRVKIRKDHVAGYREKALIQSIGFAHPTRDVKLARRYIDTGFANVLAHNLNRRNSSYRGAANSEFGIRNSEFPLMFSRTLRMGGNSEFLILNSNSRSRSWISKVSGQ